MFSVELTPLGILEWTGTLFYLVDPSKSSFKTIEDVPDYTANAFPLFIITIILEWVFLAFYEDKEEPPAKSADAEAEPDHQIKSSSGVPLPKRRRVTLTRPKWNDMVTSLTAGMLQQMINLLVLRWISLGVYVWCYEHFHVVEMDPHGLLTWILGLLCVDLGYYWVHRASHEVNIAWAAHVVHHSSEMYNQSTALRQSVLQNYISWLFYLPAALFLPPPMFLVHKHLNLLFQYWIHTETIRKLAYPIELIFNTASHHRVHHGSNAYCIDKNYAGVLIIWDRLFGTFQEEVEGTVVYGLTHPINTFDPIEVQTHHLVHIFKTAWSTPGLANKLSVVFKGPGWAPGKPRLGLISDIPHVERPSKIYDPHINSAIQAYTLVQFVAVFPSFLVVMFLVDSLPFMVIGPLSVYVIFTCCCFGYFFDRRSYAFLAEAFRLVIAIAISVAGFTGRLDFLIPAEMRSEILTTFFKGFAIFSGVCLAVILFVSMAYQNPLGVDGAPRKYIRPVPSKKSD